MDCHTLPDPVPESESRCLDSVRAFASRYEADHAHADQVARLGLILFDRLQVIHGLGPGERFLLEAGALLHDIGWWRGGKGHHLASMDLILSEPGLPLTERERAIVACIARYHRKRLPMPTDPVLCDLDERDRRIVEVLAGLVRFADGLDFSHESLVTDLDVVHSGSFIELTIVSRRPLGDDIERVRNKKADLFLRAFSRELTMTTVVTTT